MALTPEEQRELERLELQRLEARRQTAMQQPEGPAATDLRGMGTAVTQGATFGWGDEITAGATAGLAKLLGDEKPFREIYRDVKGAEQDRQNEYIAANPRAAMGLELAGGVAMPGRMFMGGKLPKSVAKSKPWQAHLERKALRRAEETALGGARRRLSRNIARGATGGAVAGAGYAETTDDISGSALTGAAIGAALPLALNTGRNVGRFMTRRRVDEELGRGADFMPIHLAADPKASTPADLYRRWVGKAFGGRKIMAEQEARYVAKKEGAKETARTALDEAREAATLAKRSKAALAAATPEDSLLLRKMAGNESLPNGAPQGLREQVTDLIQQGQMGRAAKKIDEWWFNEGFRVAKAKTYKWDGSRLFDDLDTLAKDDPALALDLAGTIERVPLLAETMQRMATKGDPIDVISTLFKGKRDISGEAMVAIRNVFAKAANRGGPKAGAMRQIANKFDDAIRRGLDPDELSQFNDQIRRYGTKETFKEAVTRAQNKKAGAFDPDDWMSAIQKDSKKAYGEGPLQRTAQRMQERGAKARGDAKRRIAETEDVRREATLLHRAMGDELTKLNRRALPKDVTPAQQALATAVLGSPTALLGAAASPVGAVAGAGVGGMLHASMLASPAVQRAIAGQTGWQKGVQKGGDWLMQDKIIQKLLREGTDRSRASLIRYLATLEQED